MTNRLRYTHTCIWCGMEWEFFAEDAEQLHVGDWYYRIIKCPCCATEVTFCPARTPHREVVEGASINGEANTDQA